MTDKVKPTQVSAAIRITEAYIIQLEKEVQWLRGLIKSILPRMSFPQMMPIEDVVEEIKAWVRPDPPKQVVWVRQRDDGSGGYVRCSEDGSICDKAVSHWLGDWDTLYKGIAEVKKLEPERSNCKKCGQKLPPEDTE